MSIQSECSLIDNIAGNIVSEGWVTWRNYADDAILATEGFFTELAAIELTPIRTDIDFDIPVDLGVPFAKPTVPTDPDLEFIGTTRPGAVNIPGIVFPAYEPPPTLDATAPTVVIPSAPDDLAAVPPSPAPDAAVITLPDVPIVVLPEEPTLEDIILPAVPTLNLPTFDAVLPTLDITPPWNNFEFTYEDYQTQIPGLVEKVQELMAGGTGLPDAIWDALWQKARTREDITGSKLVQEVTDEWAARGFSLPGGVLDKKIFGARQAVQDAQNTLSREIAIQQAQMEVENIRFAVSQGIALENLYIGLHTQQMQLTFEAARYALEAQISIFNAQIAYQNIQLQTYIAEAQVFRILIDAELANIELYKAQLEGQKLVGDINQQYITLYNSRIQAVLSTIEVYKAELDGVNAVIEVNKNEIAAFAAQVQVFSAEVAAKESEVKLFAERVNAEESKVRVYSTEVNAFAQLVQAYKTGNDTLIQQKQLELQNNGFNLEQHKVRVEQYAAEIDAEAKRISSGVGVYSGKSQLYVSELGAEQARVVADSRQFDLAIQEGRTKTDVELKEAQINIEQSLRILSLEIDKSKTILGVQAQLAAAAMSAVNMSASVSEAAANSTSCSTSTTTEL